MEEGGLSMINVDDLQKIIFAVLGKNINDRKRWKMETNSNWNDVQAR